MPDIDDNELKYRQAVKDAEATVDHDYAEAGKVLYDTLTAAENEFEQSASVAMKVYREAKDKARLDREKAITKAENDFALADKAAQETYSNAPGLARETFEHTKTDARKAYQDARKEIETRHNKRLASIRR